MIMGYRILLFMASQLLPVSYAYAVSADDTYLSGYATGVLNHQLKLSLAPLVVRDGVITLPTTKLPAADQSKAAQILAEIPGVKAVKLSESSSLPVGGANATTPVVMTAQAAELAPESVILPTGVLPVGMLFKPFLADPRWAHFSAGYRHYQSNNFTGRDSASVSFGETMPFYRANFGNSNVQWETGMQAGVFSDFNMDTSSKNLVNSDFTASLYSSLRSGRFSAFGRLYHQSSHVGDEFLLAQAHTNFTRVNLSYEALDLKLSYELPYGVRAYGGGSGFFDKDPSTLKTWSTQYGLEFRSPWLIEFAGMRPIMAADVKNFQENNWATDVSVRAGVEFENLNVWGRKLQILGEYFDGYSPIGQFYKEKVSYLGAGVHFHF